MLNAFATNTHHWCSVHMYAYENTQIQQFANIQIYIHKILSDAFATNAHRWCSVQKYAYTHMQIHKYTTIQIYIYKYR